jgi:hypothetical protein
MFQAIAESAFGRFETGASNVVNTMDTCQCRMKWGNGLPSIR